MTDLAHVERELAELADQLKQSFKVLDGLAEIQLHFEELSLTHQRFKDYIDKNNSALGDVNQLQKTIDHRFVELETAVKTRWEEMRNQIIRTQGELSTADRNLSAEVTQQISAFKREMDERFEALLREWKQQRDTMQVPIEEFEARLMTELKATLNRMNQSGVSATNFEKLDAQILSTRSSMRNVEKQIGAMRTWLVITTLVAIVALGLPVANLVRQMSGNVTTEQLSPRSN